MRDDNTIRMRRAPEIPGRAWTNLTAAILAATNPTEADGSEASALWRRIVDLRRSHLGIGPGQRHRESHEDDRHRETEQDRIERHTDFLH